MALITSVTLGSVTLNCNYVSKPKRPTVIENKIMGREGNIYQVLGSDSQMILLRGIIKGASKETDRTTLLGYKGTNQTYTDTEESFTVIVREVDIPTEGGSPSHYNFIIECSKFEQ